MDYNNFTLEDALNILSCEDNNISYEDTIIDMYDSILELENSNNVLDLLTSMENNGITMEGLGTKIIEGVQWLWKKFLEVLNNIINWFKTIFRRKRQTEDNKLAKLIISSAEYRDTLEKIKKVKESNTKLDSMGLYSHVYGNRLSGAKHKLIEEFIFNIDEDVLNYGVAIIPELVRVTDFFKKSNIFDEFIDFITSIEKLIDIDDHFEIKEYEDKLDDKIEEFKKRSKFAQKCSLLYEGETNAIRSFSLTSPHVYVTIDTICKDFSNVQQTISDNLTSIESEIVTLRDKVSQYSSTLDAICKERFSDFGGLKDNQYERYDSDKSDERIAAYKRRDWNRLLMSISHNVRTQAYNVTQHYTKCCKVYSVFANLNKKFYNHILRLDVIFK